MSKTAVIYWSQTGNTEQMAQAVAEGIKAGGAECDLLQLSDTNVSTAAGYQKLAFGCPAMGAEVLEEMEVEPFFTELERQLSGRKIALFGSYGWGDGQWMRDWVRRAEDANADVYQGEGLIVHETPDDAALEQCRNFGKGFAAY